MIGAVSRLSHSGPNSTTGGFANADREPVRAEFTRPEFARPEFARPEFAVRG
jgi:hypothetical protein